MFTRKFKCFTKNILEIKINNSFYLKQKHIYLKVTNHIINRNFCAKIKQESENKKKKEKADDVEIEKEKESNQEEEKSEVEKELEESEEETLLRLEQEEKARFMNATYTKEELDEINGKGEERIIMEIKPENKSRLFLAKKLGLYLNAPMSIIIMFLIDYGFGDIEQILPSRKPLYYALLALDYLFFLNGIVILSGVRNIVLLAKYIPKEKAVEFTKVNLFCRPYKIKDNVEDLKRAGGGNAKLTPFLSLKNKKTYNLYSMNGLGDWKDRQLFNVLFPRLIKEKNKTSGKKLLEL